jgi:hypothetical protein
LTQERVLEDLPRLLAPVMLEPNEALVALRASAIQKLVEDEVEPFALVTVAFGRGTDDERRMVSDVVQAFDPTHSVKDVVLIDHIAAASLLYAFAGGGAYPTLLAMLVESAAFAGWTPVITEVAPRATEFSFASSRSARSRTELKKQPATRLATEDLQEAVKAINAGSRRVEDFVGVLSRRIEAMDEELNVLWWSRSERTRTTNDDWDMLTPIGRQVAAALDLASLTTLPGPAAPSMLGVLAEKAFAKKAKADQVSVLDFAVESKDRVGAELGGAPGSPLLPLLTAAVTAKSYESEVASIPGVLRIARIDPEALRPLQDVGAQVLRELLILRIARP